MGKDDRGGGRDTGSTEEYKKRAIAHQAVTPTTVPTELQQTQNGPRSALLAFKHTYG